jgi:DNA-binding GntR family transcriptional regulator
MMDSESRTTSMGDVVRQDRLSAQARDAIRARLITGEIGPGTIHSVPSLAALLGVSATPVREAMLELAAEGLVEAVPNRGFKAIALSEQDLREIFELRLLLEVPATGLAASAITPARVKECRDLAGRIERAAAEADLTEFLEADRAFHLELIGAVGNQRLEEIVGRLRDQARLYGLPRLAATGELTMSAEEHSAILLAVAGGDRNLAESLTRRHLEHTRGIWAGRTEDPPEQGPPA